jgi:hypothetical protein
VSDQTFEQLYKRILLWAPECPVPIAQECVNTAYSRALAAHSWTGLRGESAFSIPAPYTTGTVTVTLDSSSVVGVGTTFTSAMTGRQLIVNGSAPFYTVTFVDATHLTLDRNYSGTSETTTFEISLVYLTPQSDFLHFISVMDVANNWKLHTGFTQEQVDSWDTMRSSSGTPWILIPTTYDSSGRPRYEVWPRATGAREYLYRYIKKPALLSANSDRPIFPIRGDILREGALAEFSKWPGTSKLKNIFYDVGQFALHTAEFEKALSKARTEDQDIAQTAIRYDDWEGIPYAPIDAAFLQTHGGPF